MTMPSIPKVVSVCSLSMLRHVLRVTHEQGFRRNAKNGGQLYYTWWSYFVEGRHVSALGMVHTSTIKSHQDTK